MISAGEWPMPDFASCTAAGVVLEQAMRSVVWNGVQGNLGRSYFVWLSFSSLEEDV